MRLISWTANSRKSILLHQLLAFFDELFEICANFLRRDITSGVQDIEQVIQFLLSDGRGIAKELLDSVCKSDWTQNLPDAPCDLRSFRSFDLVSCRSCTISGQALHVRLTREVHQV